MQELVGNRKFAEAADIQKEIDQLRAKCEATSSAVAALEDITLIKSDGHYGCCVGTHYTRSEIAAAEKKQELSLIHIWDAADE